MIEQEACQRAGRPLQSPMGRIEARSWSIPKIAIVQDPDYVPLLKENGIVAISGPWSTAAMVENYLDRPGMADLFEIGGGEARLVGVIVPEGAAVAGKTIQQIRVPPECVVAAVALRRAAGRDQGRGRRSRRLRRADGGDQEGP